VQEKEEALDALVHYGRNTMKRLLSTLFALGLLLGIFAGTAKADTTLGSIAIPGGATPAACEGAVIAETESDPSTPFTVPSAGTITSWKIDTSLAAPGAPATLVVLKSVGGINYTVVGADTQNLPNPLGPVATFTIGSPIAVSGGEILGLYDPDSDFVCYVHDGATPLTDALISLHTLSTPTAGQPLAEEDFSGGGYRLNLEATLTPPAPATPAPPATPSKKKKCKKKKHKRSAESAKKKCKKKKKR
jgi:hypothetical protein